MAEQQQNGAKKPQIPQLPEGAEFLFLAINPKTGEYSILFSTIVGALALHSMGATSLEKIKRDAIAPEQHHVLPAPPMGAFDLSKLNRNH